MGTNRTAGALSLVAILGLAAGASAFAQTAPALKLADGAGNSVLVTSAGGAVCTGVCSTDAGYPQTGSAGTIVWSGKVGAFTVKGASGNTKPALAAPSLDLGTSSISTGTTGGTLTISWTDVGFLGSGPVVMQALTTVNSGSASVTYTAYVDDTDGAFGGIAAGALTSTGGHQFMVGGGPTTQPFSMTEVVAITAQPNTALNTDDGLQAAPLAPLTGGCSSATASLGVLYSSPVTVSGGLPPYTYSIFSGVLPGGLSLNSSTGIISGTPTATGPFSFTVQVVDSSGNAGTNSITTGCGISVQITTQTQPLSVACSATAGTAGVPYNDSVKALGGTAPYTFTVIGTLPKGLTLNTQTGAITGTPSQAGNYSFTIQVTDSTTPTALTKTSTCGIAIAPSPNTPITSGDTATIGFWHNKNGQALINSLNGGSTSKALATWLSTTYPALFGASGTVAKLAGDTNAQVAAAFLTDFGVSGQKTNAQVFAGALAAYVTSSTLAGGTYSGPYGFNVSTAGTGAKTFNVGTNGAALGLTNSQSYTVSQLLAAANAKAPWTSTVFNALNSIFSGINQNGDIN